MASQPTAAVPPYAPGLPYDAPTKPITDQSYKPQPGTQPSYGPAPTTNGPPQAYKPPAAEPYFQPPPGATDPKYGPPQSSGLTYPGPPPPASSAPSYGPPPMQMMGPPLAMTDQMPGPSMTPLPLATVVKPSLKDSKAATELALREYMSLQRSRYRKGEAGIEERLRIQASTVIGDLRTLRQEVGDLVKSAESHRWRRFVVGGAIATFIPAVRTIFRRPRSETDSANDTEYAFKKSKGLISRIMGSVHRPGIATLAFFVFAVMYVFQNEVTLRVARAVAKRLKRLSSKVERGDEEINEDDMKLLQGWRWRVLLWS